MKRVKETIEVVINTPFSTKYKVGSTVVIEARDRVPVDTYWRRRIEDAKENGCVSVKAPKIRRTLDDVERQKKRDVPTSSEQIDKAPSKSKKGVKKNNPKKEDEPKEESEK